MIDNGTNMSNQKKRKTAWIYGLFALVSTVMLCLLVSDFFRGQNGEQWLTPTFLHPLGTDEFGRDILATSILATLLSALNLKFLLPVFT